MNQLFSTPVVYSDNPSLDYNWPNYIMSEFCSHAPLGYVLQHDGFWRYHHSPLCIRSMCTVLLAVRDMSTSPMLFSAAYGDVFMKLMEALRVKMPERMQYNHRADDDAEHRAVMFALILCTLATQSGNSSGYTRVICLYHLMADHGGGTQTADGAASVPV
jgi:hypothetical protein